MDFLGVHVLKIALASRIPRAMIVTIQNQRNQRCLRALIVVPLIDRGGSYQDFTTIRIKKAATAHLLVPIGRDTTTWPIKRYNLALAASSRSRLEM